MSSWDLEHATGWGRTKTSAGNPPQGPVELWIQIPQQLMDSHHDNAISTNTAARNSSFVFWQIRPHIPNGVRSILLWLLIWNVCFIAFAMDLPIVRGAPLWAKLAFPLEQEHRHAAGAVWILENHSLPGLVCKNSWLYNEPMHQGVSEDLNKSYKILFLLAKFITVPPLFNLWLVTQMVSIILWNYLEWGQDHRFPCSFMTPLAYSSMY